MRVYVDIRIEAEPSDAPYLGSNGLALREDASIPSLDFAGVAALLQKFHELLVMLKGRTA